MDETGVYDQASAEPQKGAPGVGGLRPDDLLDLPELQTREPGPPVARDDIGLVPV